VLFQPTSALGDLSTVQHFRYRPIETRGFAELRNRIEDTGVRVVKQK
jgi:hypothetical protein